MVSLTHNSTSGVSTPAIYIFKPIDNLFVFSQFGKPDDHGSLPSVPKPIANQWAFPSFYSGLERTTNCPSIAG